MKVSSSDINERFNTKMRQLLLMSTCCFLWNVVSSQPTPKDLILIIKLNDTILQFSTTKTEAGYHLPVNTMKDSSGKVTITSYEKNSKEKYRKSKTLSKVNDQNYLSLSRGLTGKYKLVLQNNKETMVIWIDTPNFENCKLNIDFRKGEFVVNLKVLPKEQDRDGNIDLTPYLSKK